ncbi:hypothetical protein GIB67_039371, partial [Kingdonia uniflora]
MWTENWTGWYKNWGGKDPSRPVEDIAYAVVLFFQSGGTLTNYYMATIYSANGTSGCFLSNKNATSSATVTFQGNQYSLPAWSVSILPDCKKEVYNTAKVRRNLDRAKTALEALIKREEKKRKVMESEVSLQRIQM